MQNFFHLILRKKTRDVDCKADSCPVSNGRNKIAYYGELKPVIKVPRVRFGLIAEILRILRICAN